jgi:hypothetical protein
MSKKPSDKLLFDWLHQTRAFLLKNGDEIFADCVGLAASRFEELAAHCTYYRDMWLAQRVENENFRKQLGLVPVSDEAERALTPRSTTPTDAHSKE